MKANNATHAILGALANGEKLTTMNGFRDFGTSKLPTRIGELERKYAFTCHRKKVRFRTRFGLSEECFEYSIDKKYQKKLMKIYRKLWKESNK